MKVLIVGYGSIAKKHISALYTIDPNTSIIALRSNNLATEVSGINNIYSWDEIPDDIDFIIISNPTSEHEKTLSKAIKFAKPIFLEKPPFMHVQGTESLIQECELNNILTYTAFNFRFHPLIQWVKKNVNLKTVREINAYCGSYLPDWRPNADYSKIYSAKAELGGGVHLDLIHEIDYIIYLFGLPKSANRQLRTVSDLNINSVDSAHYWLNYPRFTASIVLNYFRKTAKRRLEIVTTENTFELDLIDFKIYNDFEEVVFSSNETVADTYIKQLQYFISLINGESSGMNSLSESIETLKICINTENEK